MMFATPLLPLVAVVIGPLCGSAQATDYEVGTSLICDTRSQAERFVALFSGDTQAAIDAVNSGTKPHRLRARRRYLSARSGNRHGAKR